MKLIIDFDGTLTAEEKQARSLGERSLDTLANEIIGAPRRQLATAYEATRSELLRAPQQYWWEVNGLIATYCDEGAFILNTTTIQRMIADDEDYLRAVTAAYPSPEYGAVVDCSNDLFHRHTAEFSPAFRAGARDVLLELLARPDRSPVILTNSLADKVSRQLESLRLGIDIPVLGDTRQYEMDAQWPRNFKHPELGDIQIWPISQKRKIDLRRPAYYRALVQAKKEDQDVVVVADTFSMPGALPLIMGIPFILLQTSYTPTWCIQAVANHPFGYVLEELDQLPAALDALPNLGGTH